MCYSGGVLTKYVGFLGSLQYPGNLNIAFCGSAFMIVGMFLKDILNKKGLLFFCKNKTKEFVISIISFAFLLLFTYTNTNALSNEWHQIIMSKSEMGWEILFVLSGISGSLVIIFMSRIVPAICKLLSKIGKYSLTIMAVHMFILDAVQRRIKGLDIQNDVGMVVVFAITVITVVSSYFMSKIFIVFISKLQYLCKR